MVIGGSVDNPKHLATFEGVQAIVFAFLIEMRVFFLKVSVGLFHEMHFDFFNFFKVLLFLLSNGFDSI